MKKVLMIFAALLLMVTVQAQKGERAVGGGLAYGSEIEKLGINVRGYYGITEEIDAAPSFTYFFTEKEDFFGGEFKTTVWELNLDGHYKLLNEEQYIVYGLAGLNFTRVGWKAEYEDPYTGNKIDDSDSETEVGLNIGVGGQYNLNEQMGLFTDLKYVIGDFDQLVISFGIIYGL